MQQFDQKNLIVAIALSIVIVLGFEFFWNQPRAQRERAAEAERRAAAEQVAPTSLPPVPGAAPGAATATIGAPPAPGSLAASLAAQANPDRTTILARAARVTIETPVATGSITLRGGRINGQGLRFERKITLDDEYFFRIEQRVTNNGAAPVSLHGYSLASRVGTPTLGGYYILHEGPIGVFNEQLKEPSYQDLREKKQIPYQTRGGWIGIVDKYWLVALVPQQGVEIGARFAHALAGGLDRYQIDYLAPVQTVAPGASATHSTLLFAGAKEVRLLDMYGEKYNIPLFDRAIDFGWFYWLTKPMFIALEWIYAAVGNFGIAIILFTMVVKLLFYPLANKSYRSMAKMKLLQPEMEKLKEKYGDDRARMSQEMMQLYKRSGANPLSGCLPILIQIPVFFALYKVLFVTIEMRHAPFFGWIQDLSAHDPTSLFNLFGLIPWDVPPLLEIGVWPIVMGVTMFVQQKLNPQPVDPIQAKMFLALPFIFTIMLASFPAGLVIYWAVNNTLSILQQWIIMRSIENAQATTAKEPSKKERGKA